MRATRWLRFGVGSTVLGAVGILVLVACGEDDATPAEGGPDGSSEDAQASTDAGADGPTSPTGDAGTPARLQLVNAATDLGPSAPTGALRVCYAVTTSPTATPTVVGLPPLPDRTPNGAPFAGLFIGTGGLVASTGVDISQLGVVPYLMNAQTLAAKGIVKPAAGAPGKSCAEVLQPTFDAGGGPLVEGVDYWKLPAFPAGTFLKEKSYALVLTGCTDDATAAPNKCNLQDGGMLSGSAGNGSLSIKVFELDTTTKVDADKVGTQFIHAAPASVPVLASLPVLPGFTKVPGDGNAFMGITNGQPVSVLNQAPLAQTAGVDLAKDAFAMNPLHAPTSFSLQSILVATYGGGSACRWERSGQRRRCVHVHSRRRHGGTRHRRRRFQHEDDPLPRVPQQPAAHDLRALSARAPRHGHATNDHGAQSHRDGRRSRSHFSRPAHTRGGAIAALTAGRKRPGSRRG